MEVDLYLVCVALLIAIAAWILDPIETLLQLVRKMFDGRNRNFRSFADIPGPSGLPFVGTALHYITKSTTFKEFLMMHGRTYFEQYGPIYKETIMGRTIVYISDPKDAETVYKAEGKYPKRVIPQLKAIEKYYKSRGMSLVSLVQLDNEEWKKLHKVLAPKMLRPGDILENLEKLNGIAREAVDHMMTLRGLNGEMPDLEGEIVKCVAEFLGAVTLDVRIGLYDDPPNKETVKMLEETCKFFPFLGRFGGLWESLLLRFGLSSTTYREFCQTEDNAIEIGQKIVNQKVKELGVNKEEEFVENQGESLLSYLLTKRKLTPQEINLNSLDMFRAGINTTSTISLWLLYDLACHPEVQEKMYEEVSSLVGPHGDFTPTTFSMLKYVKACIKESLRLHSVSTGWSRVVTQDVVLSGYQVPAGTAVKYPDYMTGYSESLFKDPNIFKPERWLNEGMGKIQPFAFIPWGVGPRMCIGRRVAETAMYLLSAKLIQRFSLEYHEEPVGTTCKYFLVPDRPVRIRFIDRH